MKTLPYLSMLQKDRYTRREAVIQGIRKPSRVPAVHAGTTILKILKIIKFRGVIFYPDPQNFKLIVLFNTVSIVHQFIFNCSDFSHALLLTAQNINRGLCQPR